MKLPVNGMDADPDERPSNEAPETSVEETAEI